MFHLGRCGSTVLGRMLDQHPGIAWAGELYEGPTRDAPAWTGGSSPWARSRYFPGDPAGFLGERLAAGAADRRVGFEVKPYHLRLNGVKVPDYLTDVTSLGVDSFLLLSRRNHLRKVVSSLVARRDGRFHRSAGTGSGKPAGPTAPVRLDCDRIRLDNQERSLPEFFRAWDDDLDEIRQYMEGRRFLELRYEDHVEQDPREAHDRILDFLGLAPHPAKVDLERTTPDPLSRVVANLDEVRERLTGTPWSWMTDA